MVIGDTAGTIGGVFGMYHIAEAAGGLTFMFVGPVSKGISLRLSSDMGICMPGFDLA
jgi:hypothetical protein